MSKLVQTGMFVPNVKKIGQRTETTYSHTPPRKYNFEKKNHLYLVLGSRYHLIVLPDWSSEQLDFLYKCTNNNKIPHRQISYSMLFIGLSDRLIETYALT